MNAAISRLLPQDLAKVEAHIQFHKANGRRSKTAGTANTALDEDELWVLNIIVDFMRHIGADASSLELLRQSTDFPAFAKKVPPLMAYLNQAKLNKIQKRMLFLLALEILYSEKTRIGAACSARVVMREIHRVPALVDSQFPGYARAGLLAMIVRAQSHQEHMDED